MELLRAAGKKKTKPKTLTQITGTVRDEGVRRYRPHLIIAETQSDDAKAAKRADWEMRRRIAKAIKATITVNGWRQEDGRLWATNEMVWCDAPWLGLERELIIAETTFSYDDQGELTELSLTLPDAFLPDPKRKGKKEKKDAKGGGKGKKGKKKGGAGDPYAGWTSTA
jgi:prophage tail gpP-like protein